MLGYHQRNQVSSHQTNLQHNHRRSLQANRHSFLRYILLLNHQVILHHSHRRSLHRYHQLNQPRRLHPFRRR